VPEEAESPQISIYTPSSAGALRQGEIISNLVQPRLKIETLFTDEPVIAFEEHPLAIVITQDCDLDQDYRSRYGGGSQDKLIPSVLFCQMISAQDLKGRGLDRRTWDRVIINKDERYHFFQKVESEQDALGNGLPELGVDFKRYFTLPTEEVYKRIDSEANRRCYLYSPYLEHFSTRFAYYQFRIALPQDHFSEPANLSQS
jgi:hypothetical protein